MSKEVLKHRKLSFGRSDEEFLRSLNQIPVSSEDLMRAAVSDQPRSSEAAVIKVFEQHRDDPDKVRAIVFRLQALATVLEKRGLPGWSTEPVAVDRPVFTQEEVFAAAASEPLMLSGKELVFEYESFLTKVLELAELEDQ